MKLRVNTMVQKMKKRTFMKTKMYQVVVKILLTLQKQRMKILKVLTVIVA